MKKMLTIFLCICTVLFIQACNDGTIKSNTILDSIQSETTVDSRESDEFVEKLVQIFKNQDLYVDYLYVASEDTLLCFMCFDDDVDYDNLNTQEWISLTNGIDEVAAKAHKIAIDFDKKLSVGVVIQIERSTDRSVQKDIDNCAYITVDGVTQYDILNK